MISFFRRIFSSKLGLFLTMCFVGLIAIAFASADVTGSGAFGGVTSSGTAVKVGDSEISTSDLNMSINNAFRAEQRKYRAGSEKLCRRGRLRWYIGSPDQ